MLELEDFIANYPSVDTPNIQTIVTSKREFRAVAARAQEPEPKPGQYYNNQKFLLRYMIPNDRLLLTWEAGTGKSCGFGLLAEHYHKIYLKDPENAPIKRAIFLTRGPGLKDDFMIQIACRCTEGQYLTPIVVNATREQVRKSNLTREIGKWYTVESYKTFAIGLENLSDEDLIQRYSRTIIFIDEAHNVVVDNPDAPPRQRKKKGKIVLERSGKQRVYLQLQRLFRLIIGSKVILATATPMVNKASEIAPLMNLILPPDKQLPLQGEQGWDYDTVGIDQLKPYFQGRISFVKALNTGIQLLDEGEVQTINVATPSGVVPVQIRVVATEMGDIQRDAYERVITQRGERGEIDEERAGAVYDKERQISNMVFPDGSWGGNFPRNTNNVALQRRYLESGIGKYVTSPIIDSYRIKEEYMDWFRINDEAEEEDEPHLARLSSKYVRSVKEAQEGTLGTIFAYNDFVFGSGAIVQGLCFEANGFERFKGDTPAFTDLDEVRVLPPLCSARAGNRVVNIEAVPRYALITSETPAANVKRILELFNSPENLHGDYIKVLIGSQITREGYSLSHGTQMQFITTWWNPSANYQALYRIIRATSHIPLLEEERERLRELKERGDPDADPDSAVIPVEILRLVSIPDPDDYKNSTDFYMYEIAVSKEYSIRRMKEILNSIAVDCQINYGRNMAREEEVYECIDPDPEDVDVSTFDVYYIEETLALATQKILELFKRRFEAERYEIYRLLDEFRRIEVDRALTKIIANKRVIRDRFGFRSYLREEGDRFFLQREFPLTAASEEASAALVHYTANLIASREIPLPVYLNWIDSDRQNEIIEEIISGQIDIEDGIKELTAQSRASLLELAVYRYVVDKAESETLPDIIRYFSNTLYIMEEPIEDIEMVETKLLQRSKGRGRPPTKQRAIKLEEEDISTDVREIPIEDIDEVEAEREIVFIHSLYNTSYTSDAYNISANFRKGTSNLMILKPSEQVGWRKVLEPTELPVYTVIIGIIRDERIKPFEKYDIYGTLLEDGVFRVRDKTTERARLLQGKERKDLRHLKRGRKCATLDKAEEIEIAEKLGMEAPAVKKRLPTDFDDLVDRLIKRKILKVNEDLDGWDEDRLLYYAKWEAFGTRPQICAEIQAYLARNNMLVVA